MRIHLRASRYLFLLWGGFFFYMLQGPSAFATHNLAGQITLERNDPDNPLSYTITLTTYTDPSEAGVDRCAANFTIWSDDLVLVQTITDVPRNNGNLIIQPLPECPVDSSFSGVPVRGAAKRNIYQVDVVFPNADCYYIHYFDIARLTNIVNIVSPNEQAFTVVTQICVAPILGENNTPVLLNEPLFDACVGKPWTHNPGGFDQDGDSLVYYLVESEQFDETQPFNPLTNPRPVGYSFPDDQSLFINGPLVMDSVSGLITWLTPNEEIGRAHV